MSQEKSQQSSQSVTQDAMLLCSPAIFIAAISIRNIQLRISTHMSHDKSSETHHYAEKRFKIRRKKKEHVEIDITENDMRFEASP